MQSDGTQTFTVRVHPHAKRTRLRETMADGNLKIDVAAPADHGKANEELVRFLAEEFGVPVHHVEIVSGKTSRRKMIRIVCARLTQSEYIRIGIDRVAGGLNRRLPLSRIREFIPQWF